MPARHLIPSAARGMPFASAEAGELGISPKRLRYPDVAHPFHGVSAVGADVESTLGRCRAFELLMLDGQYFSHTTALALAGAPLPETGDDLVHVSVEHPRTPPRGRGVVGHAMRRFTVSMTHGLPVVDAASAWCQSASLLSREDLVAAGDSLVTGPRIAGVRRPGLVTMRQLSEAAARHRNCAGSPSIRWALPRVRCGVDSRPETLLRLLLVAAGLPEPVIDYPVDVDGGIVLHADLAYPTERLVFDYEGDGHRTSRTQWLRDIERRELFETAGQRVVRVTALDVFAHPEVFVERVRRILGVRRAELSLARWGMAIPHDDRLAGGSVSDRIHLPGA